MPGGIQPPLTEWAKWPIPNYHNPPTRPKHVLVFSCVVGPISIGLALGGLWVRVRIQRNAGLDDWLILASLIPLVAFTIIYPLVTEVYGFNKHIWDVEVKYFSMQRKYVMVIYCLYVLCSGLIKMSVLLFYRRLSTRAIRPAFRWTLRITFFLIAGYTITFTLLSIFTCRPVSAFWVQVDFIKRLRPGGYDYKCINEGVEIVTNGITCTIQDFLVASLPTLLCWKLQIPRRQKIALYAVFAVSYSTVVISAMRTYACWRIFFATYDVTWVSSDTWLWSLLEIHIGTMCANAPALKVFFKQFSRPAKLTEWIKSMTNKSGSGESRDLQRSFDTCAIVPTSASRDSVWKKVTIWINARSINSSAYSSEQRSRNATEKRISILQRNAHVGPKHDQRDSMSRPFAPEYTEAVIDSLNGDRDIEMGNVSPSTYNRNDASEPYALPPTAPKRSWLKPIRTVSLFKTLRGTD